MWDKAFDGIDLSVFCCSWSWAVHPFLGHPYKGGQSSSHWSSVWSRRKKPRHHPDRVSLLNSAKTASLWARLKKISSYLKLNINTLQLLMLSYKICTVVFFPAVKLKLIFLVNITTDSAPARPLARESEHSVLLCDTPVLFTRKRSSPAPFPLSWVHSFHLPLLFIHTNHALFRPSWLHSPPPPVLLHPRPPIISSPTHSPHHQLLAAIDDAHSATVSEAVNRFGAAIDLNLPPVAAVLLLLYSLLFFFFFFFLSHCVKKKKKKQRSHCTGWGEGTERC